MSITFHISPDGNDRNPGTADAPLATLHQNSLKRIPDGLPAARRTWR